MVNIKVAFKPSRKEKITFEEMVYRFSYFALN